MFRLALIFSMLAYTGLAIAGGPLALEGPDGITPVTYQDPNVTLDVETGDLGILSNTAANTLLIEAFQIWNKVATATINLGISQTQINTDINISNYQNYIPVDINSNDFKADDNLNPVIYDSNGEIIDAFYGGMDANGDMPSDYIIGFAASIITFGSPYYDEGYVVLNGKTTLPASIVSLTTSELKLLVAHEVGHLFGLDHTQVDINNQETFFRSPLFCSTNVQSAYPLMYPIICRSEDTLHQDDISALSALYPNASTNSNFGILQGHFVDESGRAILGANIWVENTVTGDTVSIVSDYLTQRTGFYKMHLPAGNYTLHANSINTEFYEGSGVGPYSSDKNDLSFVTPHPITEITYQGNSTGSDEIISIANGQTQVIDFALDGTTTIIPSNGNEDEDDSFADMFGATSHLTLATIFGLLVAGRLYRKRKQPDDRG